MERPLTVNEREGEEGEGVVKDLSQGGCRIATPLSVKKGCVLSLILQLAPLSEPLNIEAARVVWSAPPNYGVQFLSLSVPNQERLKRFLADHS